MELTKQEEKMILALRKAKKEPHKVGELINSIKNRFYEIWGVEGDAPDMNPFFVTVSLFSYNYAGKEYWQAMLHAIYYSSNKVKRVTGTSRDFYAEGNSVVDVLEELLEDLNCCKKENLKLV